MKRWKAAAADDRCEAQSAALVHAAADSGFKVLEMPVERTLEVQIEALRADHLSGGCDRVHAAGGKRLGQCTAGGKVGLRAADRGRSFGARCGGRGPLYHIGFDYAGLAERAAAVLSASERAVQCGDQPRQGVYS